jgi:hypothetical protein
MGIKQLNFVATALKVWHDGFCNGLGHFRPKNFKFIYYRASHVHSSQLEFSEPTKIAWLWVFISGRTLLAPSFLPSLIGECMKAAVMLLVRRVRTLRRSGLTALTLVLRILLTGHQSTHN